eukprot:123035_1
MSTFSLLSVITILIHQYMLVLSQTNNTISCGETRNGYRTASQNIEYLFQADNDYALVYLEGCDSTHDIWLQIKNATGYRIAEYDEIRYGDQADCGHAYAGDITIPNYVFDGEEYTFVIKGFGSSGNYSVTLFCFVTNHPTTNPHTRSPTVPTLPPGTCVYEPLSDKYVCECIGYKACEQSTIWCINGYDCEVICEGDYACTLADIIWPNNGTGTVTCDGDLSCAWIHFPIPPPNENLDIFCDSSGECYTSIIYCPENGECNIICNGTQACYDAHFILPVNGQGNITCVGTSACAWAKIAYGSNTLIGQGNISCDGESACYRLIFPIPDPYEDFEFICDDRDQCAGATITCPLFADCTIVCSAKDSCDYTQIVWSPNLVFSTLECSNISRCNGTTESAKKSLYFLDKLFIFGPSETKSIINDVKITKEFQVSFDIYLNETVSNSSTFTVFSIQNLDMLLLSLSINPMTNIVNLLAFSNINIYLPFQEIFLIDNGYNSVTMTVSQTGTINVEINDITYFDGPHIIPTLSTFENNQTYSIYVGADNVSSHGVITNVAIIRDLSLYFETAIIETCMNPYQTIDFPFDLLNSEGLRRGWGSVGDIAFWNNDIFIIVTEVIGTKSYRGNVKHGFIDYSSVTSIPDTWLGVSTQIDNVWYGIEKHYPPKYPDLSLLAIDMTTFTTIWSSAAPFTGISRYAAPFACMCNNYSHLVTQESNNIYTLNIQTQTWKISENVLPININNAGCHIFEQQLYIFGGWESEFMIDASIKRLSSLNSIYQYDIGLEAATILSATLSHNASVIQIIASKHFGYVFPNRGHGSPPQLHVFNFINHTMEALFKLSDYDIWGGVGYHFVGASLFAYNFQSLLKSQLRIEYAIATLYGLFDRSIFPGDILNISGDVSINKCGIDIKLPLEISFNLVSDDLSIGINHKIIFSEGKCIICDYLGVICKACNEYQLVPIITQEIKSFSVSVIKTDPYILPQKSAFSVNIIRCPLGSEYVSDWAQTIFPGDKIKIPTNITTALIQCTSEMPTLIIEFDLVSDDAIFGINHKMVTRNGICSTICDTTQSVCVACNDSKLSPTIPSKEVNSLYISIVYDNPFFLFSVATFLVNIDECNIGSGINADSSALVCSECEINQFKLTKGNEPCYSCNEQMSSDKIKCEGSDKILIAFNLWLYGLNENKQFISPFDVTQSDSILGIQCAPQHCCQLVNGCPFINAFDFVNDTKNVTFIAESGSVCAKNRNYSQPLCARCIDGTYEIFGTADCSECDSYNGLAIFLMIFAAILFVIFLIYEAKISDHSIDYKDEIDLKKLIKRDEIAMMMIMITKVMMYYFQGLNQIFTSKSITHSLSPILGLFDFSLNSLSSSSAGFCMFPFISEPLLEIVLGLFFIFCCLIHFLWVPFIVKILVRKYLVSPIELNIGAAAVKLFTISAGSILSSSFKLLGCITLPTSNIVYFYDPISKCFGIYWWIGLFSCVSVICLFAYWYRNISAQTETQRRDPKNIYKKLIKAYKPNTYYYEFILFSRRFIIAAFSSLRFMPSFDIDSILTTILVIYLTVHAYLFPFSYWRLNVLDSICMISLITILGVSSSNINKENEVFSNWFITICIIFPFGFIMYYFIKAIKMIRSIPKEQNETRNLRIQKLKNRAFIGMDESDGTKRSVSNVGRAESKGVLAENVQMKTNLDIYEKEEINVEMVAINNKNIDFSISSKMNVSNVDSSESKGVMDGNGNIQTNSDIYEKEAINAEMVVSNTDTSSSDDEIP